MKSLIAIALPLWLWMPLTATTQAHDNCTSRRLAFTLGSELALMVVFNSCATAADQEGTARQVEQTCRATAARLGIELPALPGATGDAGKDSEAVTGYLRECVPHACKVISMRYGTRPLRLFEAAFKSGSLLFLYSPSSKKAPAVIGIAKRCLELADAPTEWLAPIAEAVVRKAPSRDVRRAILTAHGKIQRDLRSWKPGRAWAACRAVEALLAPGDRARFRRMAETDDATVFNDAKDLELVEHLVARVRAQYSRVAALQQQIASLSKLSSSVPAKVLFELGLLDGDSYKATSRPVQYASERERFEAIQRMVKRQISSATEGSGLLDDDYVNPSDTQPKLRRGQLRLLNPRGNGTVIKTLAGLKRLESAPLTCDVTREVVVGYVRRTGDRRLMQCFIRLKRERPNPNAILVHHELRGRIALQPIEERILAGSVTASTIRALARHLIAAMETNEQCIAHVKRQRTVANLMRSTLLRAHANLHRAHRTSGAGADGLTAAQRKDLEHPYRYLNVPKPTPKTRAQRRAELAKFVAAAIPKKRLAR